MKNTLQGSSFLSRDAIDATAPEGRRGGGSNTLNRHTVRFNSYFKNLMT
jgi:hypothetical protein